MATEIKVWAERRAGQMLAEMPKATGAKSQLSGQFSGGPIVVPPEKTTPTLSDLGITKNDSSRWQKLAGISDEKFEAAVAAAKDAAGQVTTAAMVAGAMVAGKVAVTGDGIRQGISHRRMVAGGVAQFIRMVRRNPARFAP
ncbi:hypothetical protein [Candidatus Accumulibacter phosphatis]|uniref:Uncharacterized protein n=1 Tax=Candidatus Accumulibacter phosphatis TaxID=327160 RepID=A0A5S4EGH9_9PROT|nr:hypothetical protein [Candidatus Accumulibacter phosphatis]TMQ74382.1 hypothetical protein ACCUM_1702 [Candidatus Accumulibacter phosphatis]